MLSSHNCKALSGDVARRREEAARDTSGFTTEELAFLEVGPAYPVKGDSDRRDENFSSDIISSDYSPLDRSGKTKAGVIDIRQLPGKMGGNI